MLEKGGGRCRTDGPIRVLSCQRRHTIAAIKPAWSRLRRTPPTARGSPQLAASAESLVTDAERSNRRITCLLHIISDVTRVRQGTRNVEHRMVHVCYRRPEEMENVTEELMMGTTGGKSQQKHPHCAYGNPEYGCMKCRPST